MGYLTYGAVKERLARTMRLTPDDPLLVEFVNTATRQVVEATHGLFVGGVESIGVSIADGTLKTFDLPPAYLSIVNVEQLGAPAEEPGANSGWFNVFSPAAFVTPEDWSDNVPEGRGQTLNGSDQFIRHYALPSLLPGVSNLLVTATKRFLPIAGADGDVLLVQNVDALATMMLAVEKLERRNDPEGHAKYKAEALQLLLEESRHYVLDPMRVQARKSAWQQDERVWAVNTLGREMARVALEVRGALAMGRDRLARYVRRAAEWLYQRRWEFQLIERNRIVDSAPTLASVPTIRSGGFNPPLPPEILRQVAQALMAEDNQGLDEDRGSGKLTPGAELTIAKQLFVEAAAAYSRTLEAELEQLRHTTYADGLQAFLTAGATSALGYFSGKVALDLPNGLHRSRAEVNRALNEAARAAVAHYNFLGRQERYSNSATGPNTRPFALANGPNDPLAFPVWEVLRPLTLAELLPDDPRAKDWRAEAFALIERNLAQEIESERNALWRALIQSNPFPQFGGARAMLGLEFGNGAGYELSDAKASRIVAQGWTNAVEHRNFLARREEYEVSVLPVPASVPAAGDSMAPFSFEVIKLFAEGLLCQDHNEETRGQGYKQQAQALVERDLTTEVETARREARQARVARGEDYSFGYNAARLGLEFLGLSDAQVGRLINEAEELLVNGGHWKNLEAEFRARLGRDGTVELPADTETILMAELCGVPVEIRHRKFQFMHCGARTGNDGAGGFALDDLGYSEEGNRRYRLGAGCCPGGFAGCLRAVVRRRWLPKTRDDDALLVQCFPALKSMVLGVQAKAQKPPDYQGFAIHRNSAAKAIDDQLGTRLDGETARPRFNFPGLSGRGSAGRRGRNFVR